MSGTNSGGTASSQDRARQPQRAGGNSPAAGIEQHDQAKGMRAKQGGAGDMTTGKDSTFGLGFNGGGNSAKGAGEKHSSSWSHGGSYNNKPSGTVRDIPANVEVADRTESNGNCANGSHEPTARGSKTVPASRRFDG